MAMVAGGPRRKKSSRCSAAGGSCQSLQKPAPTSKDVSCAVCAKLIAESTSSGRGDDALQCDGCQHWFHRWCTGVSTFHYASLSVSNDSFYCYVCLQKELRVSVVSLKDQVRALLLELDTLKAKCSCSHSPAGVSASGDLPADTSTAGASTVRQSACVSPPGGHISYAASVGCSGSPPVSSGFKQGSVSMTCSDNRKSNLVIMGIPECDKGSRRHLRHRDSLIRT